MLLLDHYLFILKNEHKTQPPPPFSFLPSVLLETSAFLAPEHFGPWIIVISTSLRLRGTPERPSPEQPPGSYASSVTNVLFFYNTSAHPPEKVKSHSPVGHSLTLALFSPPSLIFPTTAPSSSEEPHHLVPLAPFLSPSHLSGPTSHPAETSMCVTSHSL